MDKPRVEVFDIAKAIGILLVVVGHVLPEDNFFRVLIYTFHMPLFFMLSGVFINIDYKSTKDAIYYGIRNLVICYFFWSAMYILFDLVVECLILRRATFIQLVVDVYLTLVFRGILVLWFLPALIVAKIITIVLARATRSRVIFTAVALVLFLASAGIDHVLVVTYTQLIDMVFFDLVTSILRALMITAFVLIGYAYKDWLYRIAAERNLATQMVCVLCIALNMLVSNRLGTINYYYLDSGLPLVSLVMGIGGTVAVLGIASLIAQKPRKTMAFWSFISKNSTFIFATHMYFAVAEVLSMVVVFFNKYDNDYIRLVLLLLLELTLCLTVAPVVNKTLTRMSKRSDLLYEKRQLSNN